MRGGDEAPQGRRDLPEKEVLQYTYDARAKKWDVFSEIYQVESIPWATGARRRCHRCWRKGSDDVLVFKQYLQPSSSEQARPFGMPCSCAASTTDRGVAVLHVRPHVLWLTVCECSTLMM
jgi:hypothetical protein